MGKVLSSSLSVFLDPVVEENQGSRFGPSRLLSRLLISTQMRFMAFHRFPTIVLLIWVPSIDSPVLLLLSSKC